MIINNAASRCDVDFWTKHLTNTEQNERAELKQIRGLEATSLQDALLEIQREAADRPRLKNFMYHADFNPRGHERFTERQWERAFEIFEKERGIPPGQSRVVYEHEKEGRIHRHVIWARLNPETMRAFADGLDAKIAHVAAEKIAFEFGFEKIASPLTREPGTPRPPRAPEAWEMYRGMKTGIDPRDITAEVTALREQSDTGHAFQTALEQRGYQLVTGDRGLLILDSAGKEHSLAKRSGMKMKDLNAFMRDVDRTALPTLEQGKEQYQQRKIAALEADRDTVRHEIEWEETLAKAAIAKEEKDRQFVERPLRTNEEPRSGRQARKERAEAGGREKDRGEAKVPAPVLGKTQAEIRLARALSPGPQSFANTLEDRGFILAAVTAADIEKDLAKLREEWEERRQKPQSWMEHEGGYAALPPAFQASARRSFEEWQQRKGQQPDPQKPNAFKPDEDLTRVQKEWIESLSPQHQGPASAESEATKQQREDYVEFVQRQWAKGPRSQLERAEGGLAVVTPFGSVFTLTPRNTGLSREELPHYLQGIDRAPLLSVTDAQAVMEDVQKHRKSEGQHRYEEWQMRQPIGATAAGIRLAYALTQNGPDFAAAIEDRGLTVAVMNGADAERLNRWERQRLREQAQAVPDGKGQDKQRDIESYEKLVIVNQYGSVFQLTAATTGAHTAEREARLNQIDRAPLMNVTAAQLAMQEYQQHQRQEWQEQRNEPYRQGLNEKLSAVAPPQPERQSAGLFTEAANEAAADHRSDRSDKLGGTAEEVSNLYRRSANEYYFDNTHEASQRFSLKTGNREAFAAALEDNGIAFAKVTAEEAYRSHRQAEFAKATGNYAPRYKEDEIVAVTEPGREYHRDGQWKESRHVHKLDAGNAEKYLALLEIDRKQLQGIEATKTILNGRAEKRTAERDAKGLERAIKITDYQLSRQKTPRDPKESKSATRIMAAMPALAFGAIGKSFDIVTSIFDGILSPKLTLEQIREGERAIEKRSAEADNSAEFANHMAQLAQERQQRQAEEAARDRQRELERDR